MSLAYDLSPPVELQRLREEETKTLACKLKHESRPDLLLGAMGSSCFYYIND